jgi:hypothetical protein
LWKIEEHVRTNLCSLTFKRERVLRQSSLNRNEEPDADKGLFDIQEVSESITVGNGKTMEAIKIGKR